MQIFETRRCFKLDDELVNEESVVGQRIVNLEQFTKRLLDELPDITWSEREIIIEIVRNQALTFIKG